MTPLALSAAALLTVLLIMLAELAMSRANERWLRANGAVEAPDEVYGTMRWAYPATFVAMGLEGAFFGPTPGRMAVVGVLVLIAAKLLKYWAIASLGRRWSYGVLTIPGAPLVVSGPYRWLRHPNYVGVLGELVGMAILVGARISGPLATIFFASLLWRRIVAEERALNRAPDLHG